MSTGLGWVFIASVMWFIFALGRAVIHPKMSSMLSHFISSTFSWLRSKTCFLPLSSLKGGARGWKSDCMRDGPKPDGCRLKMAGGKMLKSASTKFCINLESCNISLNAKSMWGGVGGDFLKNVRRWYLARKKSRVFASFLAEGRMMREQKSGATFVERLLGGERRRPYQRNRGEDKLEDHRAANRGDKSIHDDMTMHLIINDKQPFVAIINILSACFIDMNRWEIMHLCIYAYCSMFIYACSTTCS